MLLRANIQRKIDLILVYFLNELMDSAYTDCDYDQDKWNRCSDDQRRIDLPAGRFHRFGNRPDQADRIAGYRENGYAFDSALQAQLHSGVGVHRFQ